MCGRIGFGVCVALSFWAANFSSAAARETWRCNYPNAPEDFPSSIEFWVERDQVFEPSHLPYRILENNEFAIIAVATVADKDGHYGPAGHTIQQVFSENQTVWHDELLVYAETLEIERQTGNSIIVSVRMGDYPILPIRGTCKLA